jgi:hypothetical protein
MWRGERSGDQYAKILFVKPVVASSFRPGADQAGLWSFSLYETKAADVPTGFPAPQRRLAAAEVKSARQSAAIAVLRRAVVMIYLLEPLVVFFMVTSRTWCRASISQ